jgi:hypothetical protein
MQHNTNADNDDDDYEYNNSMTVEEWCSPVVTPMQRNVNKSASLMPFLKRNRIVAKYAIAIMLLNCVLCFSVQPDCQQSPGSQAVPKKRISGANLSSDPAASRLNFNENGDNEMCIYETENVVNVFNTCKYSYYFIGIIDCH